jgi:DNA-binding NarL/FixJ family response regulator
MPAAGHAVGSIAVTIEPTPPIERTALFARACGLSPRETQLLQLLLSGADTHDLAGRMVLSENTIQDHLKSIFTKTGTTTRRSVIAHAVGV